MTRAGEVAVDLEAGRGLLQQPLDLELGFCRTRHGGSEVKDGLSYRRKPLDAGIDKHVRRTAKYAVRQKEVAETVGVVSLYSPPLHDGAHSNVLPGHGRNAAQGKLSTWNSQYHSDKAEPPVSYGVCCSSFFRNLTQTGMFSPVGCAHVPGSVRSFQ